MEREWLRAICRASTEDFHEAIAVPAAVRERLLLLGLIAPHESSFEVTPAGLAEALRTCG